MIIPDNLKRYKAVRFDSVSKRRYFRELSLYDFMQAVTSCTPLAENKAEAPAWALCNSTGDSTGVPNGLLQLDFDDVGTPEMLKKALAEYGGLIAVFTSFSGHGVCAIADIGIFSRVKNVDIESLVLGSIKKYLAVRGFSESDYSLDPSCTKPCQLRYESRDHDAWISPNPARLCLDVEDDSAISLHPLSILAESICPLAGLSNAAIAAALTCVGIAVNAYSAMTEDSASYPARSFCVIIGEPGCGKTSLLMAVQDIARRIGVTVSDPKNAPTLREHILSCGCDEIVEQASEGRKVPEKIKIERTDGEEDPLLVCIDEAGQVLRTRVADESCGSLAAMLRKCNSGKITIESTVKQAHKGSYVCPSNVSVVLGTTLPQWAEYVATVKQENGEARRIIEFIQTAGNTDIFATVRRPPDIDTAVEMLDRLASMSDLWKSQGRVFIPEFEVRGLIRYASEWLQMRGVDAPSAQSLVMCYSTLLAAVRASQDGGAAIKHIDVAACLNILSRVLEARNALKDFVDKAGQKSAKSDNSVWAEIMGWIEKTPRRDKLLEKIARRPTQYRRVYDEMIAKRALMVAKDASTGKYLLRPASAEELEAAEEKREAITSDVFKPAQNAPRDGQRKSYAECDDNEKRERILAYYVQFRKDSGISEGTRNNTFSRLAFMLQKNGMWDDVARTFVSYQAEKAGLGQREIKLIVRDRNI